MLEFNIEIVSCIRFISVSIRDQPDVAAHAMCFSGLKTVSCPRTRGSLAAKGAVPQSGPLESSQPPRVNEGFDSRPRWHQRGLPNDRALTRRPVLLVSKVSPPGGRGEPGLIGPWLSQIALIRTPCALHVKRYPKACFTYVNVHRCTHNTGTFSSTLYNIWALNYLNRNQSFWRLDATQANTQHRRRL